MKKNFLVALFILVFALDLQANAVEKPTEVTFIYINGSNNLTFRNRDKFRVNFLESVEKLHPQIKKRFDSDETIQEVFLKNGQYVINPNTRTKRFGCFLFYWIFKF